MTMHKYDEPKKMETHSQTNKMRSNNLDMLVEAATSVYQGEIQKLRA
jgi:hypothetical protein